MRATTFKHNFLFVFSLPIFAFKMYHLHHYLLLILCPISGHAKIHVEVLYESLCPDSLNFITRQLDPVFNQLTSYIDLKLTPFGKSVSLENGAQFICQHGPQECKGNRIQSCALNAIANQSAQVEYVNCFMQTFRKGVKNEHEFGQRCTDAVGITFDHVAECYSSHVGANLQLLAEQSTARISPKFIPTILYNGQFNQQLQDDSLVDFKGVICQLLLPEHPKACKSITY